MKRNRKYNMLKNVNYCSNYKSNTYTNYQNNQE